MDLNPLVNDVFEIAAAVAVPCALMLVRRFALVLESKLNITVTAQDEERLANEVNVGVGVLRAKLASGHMALSDVQLGSTHVDGVAEMVLNSITGLADAAGMNKADIAERIVGELGHVLGEDPSVPSVVVPGTAVAPPPAPVVVNPVPVTVVPTPSVPNVNLSMTPFAPLSATSIPTPTMATSIPLLVTP